MLAKMQRGPQPYLLAQLQKAQEDNVGNLIWAAIASPWWSGDLGHILQIFSLCLWVKTTLCTNKMQTPQPPVQLLSCKEGKTLRVKLTWKELVMIHLRRGGRLSLRLFRTEHKGEEKNTLTMSSSAPWPRVTFTCYVPAPWHLSFSLALTAAHKLGGVIHGLQMRKLRLGEQGRWLVQGHRASKWQNEYLNPDLLIPSPMRWE